VTYQTLDLGVQESKLDCCKSSLNLASGPGADVPADGRTSQEVSIRSELLVC
jgi:hypothetical protein